MINRAVRSQFPIQPKRAGKVKPRFVGLGSAIRLSRSDDPLMEGNTVDLVAGHKAERKLEVTVLKFI